MSSIARRLPSINIPRRNAAELDFVRALAGLAQFSYQRGFLNQSQISSPAQWITVREASERSGLSVSLIRRLIAVKKLDSFRDGPIKVKAKELENLTSADLAAAQQAPRKKRKAAEEEC